MVRNITRSLSLPHQSINQLTEPTLTDLVAPPTPTPFTLDSAAKEFPSVFDGQIRTMIGEELHISLTADAKPFCVGTPRTIPFIYRDKLRTELDVLLRQKIIAPVTEATEWCAPIVVTLKKGSKNIRICVDLSHLNRFVCWERYQSPTPAESIADIATANARYFTVMDATNVYHQCPLDSDSQILTMFITPFGRFKFLRASMASPLSQNTATAAWQKH